MTALKRIVLVGLAAGLAVIVTAPAFAADPTDLILNGGSFAITPPTGHTEVWTADFGTATLDGTQKTLTAALDSFKVTDARGTGIGWNVTVQATQFKQYDPNLLGPGLGGYVTSGRSLAFSSLTMAAPTIAKADATSSGPPSGLAATGIDNNAGTAGAPAGVKFASAATGDVAGSGMGSYDFSAVVLTLKVPASAYKATYRSEVTVSLNSTP